MIRSICFISLIFALTSIVPADAQQHTGGRQGNRRQALVLDINTRVLSDDQEAVWNESQRRITIPGNPVGIRLFGSNVVVAVQFTPVMRREGNVLVAQGQIWIDNPNGGVSYHTSVQTIPMDLNEPILFFPLGTSNPSIEITITVNPYSEIAALEESAASTSNGN